MLKNDVQQPRIANPVGYLTVTLTMQFLNHFEVEETKSLREIIVYMHCRDLQEVFFCFFDVYSR